MVGAYFALTPPKPKANAQEVAQRSLRHAQMETVRTRALVQKAELDLKGRTWDLAPEGLGARLMDGLGGLASRRGLQVANFSAGRIIEGAGLRQAPFTVTLEGAFTDVMAAVDEIEGPAMKVALRSVSISPKEAEGQPAGRVAATLALTAFMREESK